MIDYANKDLFYKSSIDKQLKIYVVGGSTIGNTLLYAEDFSLQESICSSNTLKFGLCESSILKFKVRNEISSLTGEKLSVSSILNNDTSHPFEYGVYKVVEDKPNGTRQYREVVAYDSLYEVLNSDFTSWYNTVLPSADSTVTLKQFRDSFFGEIGITQETVTLANDSMIVTKTIDPQSISGKQILNAICELNGCFGHIGRDNKFKYVFLNEYKKGLFPSPTLYPRENLYPEPPRNIESINRSYYISLDYKDFDTKKIDKLQIRKEENDVGCIVGNGNNCYVVQDNFLVYGKNQSDLTNIANNLFNVIKAVTYNPATVNAVGNPCIEVGDAIKIVSNEKVVYTYVLQRTLKGIQALFDEYKADGEYAQSEKVNSVNESITQLKGKTNKLVRTVDELSSEINDAENGLKTKITQNANSITSEVQRATSAEESLSSRITQTDQKITLEVNSLQKEIDGSVTSYNVVETPTLTNYPAWDFTYNIPCNGTVLCGDVGWQYKDEYYQKDARSLAFDTTTFISYRFLKGDDGEWHWIEIADSEYSYILEQVSKLKIEAGKIEATVESNKTYSDEQIESLSSRITQTATSISSEVTRATTEEGRLSSAITINAEAIVSEVSRAGTAEGNLSSRITQTADSITAEVTRATTEESRLSSAISINAEYIQSKVSKGSVISEINQTAETVTISASRIDLNGVVNATELTSKYATLETLGVTNARVDYISSNYITASYINATNICSALSNATQGSITVGTVRLSTLQRWDGGSNEYKTCTPQAITINGTTYRLLGYK